MMKPHSLALPARQHGVSLIVTLMIVVLLSLLGLYGAGILVLDTRSAANDFRAREALAAAESGTEQGLGLLDANRARIDENGLDANNDGDVADATDSGWTACTSTTAQCLPVRTGDRTNWQFLTLNAGLTSQPTAGNFTLFLLTPIPDADPDINNGSLLVYNVVALGASADGTSNATVKQGAFFYPLLKGNVSTPLAAASNIPLSGNYSVITNSNGGGTGVPVTAWARCANYPTTSPCNTNYSTGGSFASCHIGDFSGGACPSSDALSKASLIGPDLITDPDFPPDLFEFLFGVPAADFQQIKDEATVYANCSSLSTASFGLIWITGDCNPSGSVGSTDNPVLLVVEGDTTLNAGSQLYGLLYMFKPTGTAPKLIANGNAHLHGAVFAHNNVDLQLNGGFVLEYDKSVLDNLRNGPSGRGLARIPGTWSDVQQ
jgi:Tfp pilus assembly protein PilX